MGRKKTTVAELPEVPQNGLGKVQAVADYLNTSKFTIYRMLNNLELDWVWVRGQKRVKWESVHKYLQQG